MVFSEFGLAHSDAAFSAQWRAIREPHPRLPHTMAEEGDYRGQYVRIVKTSRDDLNGTVGLVLSTLDETTGRYAVRLDGPGDSPGGRVLAMKPANLFPLGDTADARDSTAMPPASPGRSAARKRKAQAGAPSAASKVCNHVLIALMVAWAFVRRHVAGLTKRCRGQGRAEARREAKKAKRRKAAVAEESKMTTAQLKCRRVEQVRVCGWGGMGCAGGCAGVRRCGRMWEDVRAVLGVDGGHGAW